MLEQKGLMSYAEGEILALQAIKSENVIKLYDWWENDVALLMVTDYCETGDLKHYISTLGSKCLSEV